MKRRGWLPLWLGVLAVLQPPPAHAAMVLGPEQAVDLSPSIGPVEVYSAARIAFDGTQYLVVWFDINDGSRRLYATRVLPDGTLLDPTGFAITMASSYQDEPAVTSSGDGFLVTWVDNRGGPREVFAARVASNGTVLDPAGVRISTSGETAYGPTVAFGGGSYLIAWSRSVLGAPDIRMARLAPDGTVLAPGDVQVALSSVATAGTKVAFGGGVFMLVWQDFVSSDRRTFGARIDPDGTILGGGAFEITNGPGFEAWPQIASDGSNFYLAWQDARSGTVDVYGTRLTAAGVPESTTGTAIRTGAGNQSPTDLVFDGTQYWLVWGDHDTVTPELFQGARIQTDGTLVDPSPGLTLTTGHGSDEIAPALGVGPGQMLLVWQDTRSTPEEVLYASRITLAGARLDGVGFPVSRSANAQNDPASCFAGSHHWLVWTDARSSAPGVYAARVTATGTLLDATPVAVATQPGVVYAQPRVACGNGTALAVWGARIGGTFQVEAARLDATGAVVDGTPLVISTTGPAVRPDVASDGQDFFVVWDSADDAFGARVTRDGTLVDSPAITLSAEANTQYGARVVWEQGRWRAVWADGRGGNYQVYTARIDPTGAVLDPAGVLVSPGTGAHQTPAIAVGAGISTVVWEDWTSGGVPAGVRIDGAGTVTPIVGLAGLSPGRVTMGFTVAFDGTDFGLAWRAHVLGSGYDQSDIHGTRLGTDGQVLDSPAVTLAGDVGPEWTPSLSSDGAGRSLFSYARFTMTAGFRTWRVQFRSVSNNLAQGAVCTQAPECSGGFCVGGVCCDGPVCGATLEVGPELYRIGCSCAGSPGAGLPWPAVLLLGAVLALGRDRRRSAVQPKPGAGWR